MVIFLGYKNMKNQEIISIYFIYQLIAYMESRKGMTQENTGLVGRNRQNTDF